MDDHRPDDAPEHIYDKYQRPGDWPAVAPPDRPWYGYLGWVLLSIFFALMIAESFVPAKPGDVQDSRVSHWELQLKPNISLRHSQLNQGMAENEMAIKELAPLKEANNEAAILWATYKDLAGQPIEANEIQKLATSKEADDKAFAKVYGNKKLTSEEAQKLQAELPKSTAGRYAAMRAKEKAGEKVDWNRYNRGTQSLWVFAGALFLVAIFGGLMLIGFVFLRVRGYFPPVGHPALPMTGAEADGYALRALLLLLVPSLISIPLPIFPGRSAVSAILGVAACLLIGRFYSLGHKVDRYRFAHSVKGWPMVLQGLGIYVMGLPLIGLSMIVGNSLFSGLPSPQHPLTTAAPTASAIALFGMMLLACVQAPIVEEITFRGSLMPALMKVTKSPWFGIVLTNLLFAAIHPTGVPSWLTLATIGIVASFAVIQTGSIWTAVVVHAAHNGVTMAMVLLSYR